MASSLGVNWDDGKTLTTWMQIEKAFHAAGTRKAHAHNGIDWPHFFVDEGKEFRTVASAVQSRSLCERSPYTKGGAGLFFLAVGNAESGEDAQQ